MFGVIYIGLSGFNVFSCGLQMISNNVVNFNMLGFKVSEVSFIDVYSYGGGGLIFFDGVDNVNVGNGVWFGEVWVDFGQGDLWQFDGDFDFVI